VCTHHEKHLELRVVALRLVGESPAVYIRHDDIREQQSDFRIGIQRAQS
jgi:hypothetical protein